MTAHYERVCAVVVTFNRKDMLRMNLDGLRSQSQSVENILVVNNACTDGTAHMIRDEFPDVTLLNLTENIGGAGGFNAGMRWAYEHGYDWVWCMDDDAIPAVGCLQELLDHAAALGNRPLILCPKIVHHATGALQLFHHKQITPDLVDRPLKRELLQHAVVKIDANGFVGPLVNRAAIEIYGLPISEYFYQADDLEYTYRLGVEGGCYLVTGAVIFHNDKVGAISERKLYYWRRNYTHFVRLNSRKRHFSPVQQWWVLAREAMVSLYYSLALFKSYARGYRGGVLGPVRGYIDAFYMPLDHPSSSLLTSGERPGAT